MCLPNNINLHYLSFEDVDPWFLEELTRSIFLDTRHDLNQPAPMELHLKCGASSCDIPLDVQTWKYAGLVLEGYDQAHLIAGYPFDQENFLSSQLHLINCPGFTDTQLKILSKVDPETKDPLFSSNLTYLKLTDCHDFTMGIQKMLWHERACACRFSRSCTVMHGHHGHDMAHSIWVRDNCDEYFCC